MRTLKPRLALLPLGAAALLAAGCASSQSAHGATTTLVPASTTTTTVPAAAAGAPTTTNPSATVVTATENEFHIQLSQQSFTPGTYTFRAINAGHTIHNLAITGPGVTDITHALSPGETAELTVTLKKGSYDIFCAIDDHKGLGMNVNITVS